ncbi:MAG: hypothetical protein R3B13_04390 [Polyangiaceae bacterium]
MSNRPQRNHHEHRPRGSAQPIAVALLLPLLFTPIGCRKPKLHPWVKDVLVEGNQLVFSAGAVNSREKGVPPVTRYSINGVTREEALPKVTFVLDLDGVPPGPQTWPIEMRRGKLVGTTLVSFVVPKAKDELSWKVVGCRSSLEIGEPSVFLTGKLMQSDSTCGIDAGGEVELHYVGTPGAEFALAGRETRVADYKEHRPHVVRFQVASALTHLPLSDVVWTDSERAEAKDDATIAVHVSRGERTLDESIKLSVSSPMTLSGLIADQLVGSAGKGLRGFHPAKDAHVIIAHGLPRLSGRLWATDTKATLADVSGFAKISEANKRNVGSCGPYSKQGGMEHTVGHEVVDLQVDVYDVSSGRKLESKTFAATEQPCPGTLSATDEGANTELGTVRDLPADSEIENWLRAI